MNSKKQDQEVLDNCQKQVLIGYLLGDGCLETWDSTKATRLKVEQSLKQKEFVFWLYEIFKNFVKTEPKVKVKSIYFNTRSLQCFYEFRQLFYKEKKKVIPINIDEILTPLSLAVWFMGDGSVKSKQCNGRILNTHGFTQADIQKACDSLNKNFSLSVHIRQQKDGLQIYISAKSARKLYQIVSPYLLPIFRYKLPKI